MPRPVSIYFHNKAKYDCRKCGGSMNRLDAHGWHWGCPACKVSFPLYVLEPSPNEKKGFLDRVKDTFMGRKDGRQDA